MTSSPEGRQEAAVLDAKALAEKLGRLQIGTKKRFDETTDMWFFELWHALGEATEALSSVALIPAKPAVEVVEALKAALKPFARIAEMEPNTPDGESTIVNISRCREALAALQAPATPDAQTEVDK